MKIKFFCPRWGSENLPWKEFVQKVRAAGFDGIEASIPLEEKQKLEIKDALKSEGLELIGQYYQSFESEFEVHKDNFEKHLENIIELKPILIVSQTGKDYFQRRKTKISFKLPIRLAKNQEYPCHTRPIAIKPYLLHISQRICYKKINRQK
ncbi:sugar phosphate isomerase/epimerase [Flavobacterium psychroterrae]|uniref:Sugar phosphate isomerase/epimerase n=1 Tax=Flavobacterium psychroterrae TaxID=2133767 RepID=A0ABS5PHJ0_9FLAO|nr:hypothetical protein [Flavobacterium psychroterrae]MBS7233789.1 sugar phosphate isomerase/epimerase [Flavobacterium psychroterrae]